MRLIYCQTANMPEKYGYVQNRRGDVLGTVNSVIGTISRSDYDGYGNTDDSVYGNLGYCGEYRDAETGFIYLRARYYDPSLGRFTSEDPARDGSNWYAYCANNPVNFIDPSGMWLEGDEKLSVGAQTYTRYYGEQWEAANKRKQDNLAMGDLDGAAAAQADMDEYHRLANQIRVLDANGHVQGKTLPIPVYNQLNTQTGDMPNNLCWATASAMVASYQLEEYGDTAKDRTLYIATQTANSTNRNQYNVPRSWRSTSKIGLGISDGQQQFAKALSQNALKASIDNNLPIGALYGANVGPNRTWSGHWVVIVGYASAEGHELLVVSNDPYGGVQRIQTYEDFKNSYVGDKDVIRPWVETAY